MAQTYQQIIDKVERELRAHDAFPDASTKEQEQIDAIYRYGVALSKELPLSRLTVEKSSELSATPIFDSRLYEAALPSDVNDARQDLGILQVELEFDSGETTRMNILEAQPYESLKAAAINFYQEDNTLFSADLNQRLIFYPTSVSKSYVRYAKKIPSTTTGALGIAIPMDDNSIEVLVEAVAAHFTSVNAKDFSASQIHSTLSQILKE